jgi:hypothetical protein
MNKKKPNWNEMLITKMNKKKTQLEWNVDNKNEPKKNPNWNEMLITKMNQKKTQLEWNVDNKNEQKKT